MMFLAFKVFAAATAAVVHFGAHDDVRVETLGSNIRITAYGPAAHVPLLLTPRQVDACARELGGESARCSFVGQGTIVLRRDGAAYRMTFADPLDANVVDIDLDEAGLHSALDELRTLAESGAKVRR